MDVKWGSSAIPLKDAIKCNQFPLVAKVNEPCEIIDGKTLKKGELITIHGKRTVVKFHGFDNNGCEIFIPANFGVKARLRVPADSAIYQTVKDICLVDQAPKFVEITQDREHGTQQNALKIGDRLKVLLVERNGDGPTHMHFRNQSGKHVRLPADFEGPFKPCSEDNMVHSLLELAKHPLPFTIEVVTDSEDKLIEAKLNGIVQIIDILTEDIALTSVQHKKIYAVVLPINTSNLFLYLPENKTDAVYEELSDHFKSGIDVNLLQSYVDKQCSSSKSSTLYSPYEVITQTKLSKKEKRFSQIKTSSLGSKHDVKLHPIKAASKLLKSRRKSTDSFEKKDEKKAKLPKTKSMSMFKDMRRKKLDTAEPVLEDNNGNDPASPISDDRCSVTSSPSPAEERKMTSIDESDNEAYTQISDTDDYEEPLPSPGGTKSKTNTLIGRMWKKVKAQKTKSGGSIDGGSVKNGNHKEKTQSAIIAGDLYSALEQYDDEGLYDEIPGQMAYESLDIFQEAKRAIGMPSPHISTENSGDSGFVELQSKQGSRHSNSPLPPLPPNHPMDKSMERSYSQDDIYEESVDQLTANQLQTFYEGVQKSEQEIAQWSSEELASNLTKLQLSAFIEKFNDSQIDGGLLIDLDEAVFKDLGMSSFQARKLRKFVFGWRTDEMKTIQVKERDDDATTWSGSDVVSRLTAIGMAGMAKFCKSNQVNGDLLKDIVVDDQIMNEVLSGSDKRLKSIKIRNYVVDAWRPRLKSDASALTNKKKLKKIQTDEIDIGERKSTPPNRRSVHKYVAPVVTSNQVTSNAPVGSRIASIKQQLMNNSS